MPYPVLQVRVHPLQRQIDEEEEDGAGSGKFQYKSVRLFIPADSQKMLLTDTSSNLDKRRAADGLEHANLTAKNRQRHILQT